jgi:dipeptidase E
MKLWLYSSGDLDSNRHIDEALLRQIGKRRPRYCYIPSSYEDADYYFAEFAERFGSYGPCNFQILHLDQPILPKELSMAMKSDLIYLSGGNTFYFLKHIRSAGIESELYAYLRSGGILAGHSAGAIVMTPNINTASYPEDDRDDNDVGLTNLRAMKFCSFEVFPHYLVRSRTQNKALREASKNIGHVIYGVPDGAAIAVNGPSLTVYGPVWGFVEGQRFSIKA